MFKTKIQILVVCMALVVAGCVNNSIKSAPTAKLPVTPQSLVPGKKYQIVTSRAKDNAKISYRGTLEESNDDNIILNGASKTVVVERTSRIPVVGQLFTNKALVDYKNLSGKVSVARTGISEIRELSLENR